MKIKDTKPTGGGCRVWRSCEPMREEKPLIVDYRIKARGSKRNLQPGDYVLLTETKDRNMAYAWRIGILQTVTIASILNDGTFRKRYKAMDDPLYWDYCWRISPEDGAKIIETYNKYKGHVPYL